MHKSGIRNCQDDAFYTAAATLKKRANQYARAELQAWFSAQNQVFRNCSNGHDIPEALASSAGSLAHADRDYQIAAAYFYSEDWDRAAQLFLGISKDPGSPWQKYGRYLAARCYVRKAAFTSDKGELKKAVALLDQDLDQVKDKDLAKAIGKMRNLVTLRSDPALYYRGVVQAVSSPHPNLEQNLIDYFWFDTAPSLNGEEIDEINRIKSLNDLSLWISVMSSQNGETAREEFHKKHTVIWLVAALSTMTGSEGPDAMKEVLESAESVTRDSPAYQTVKFHQIRLLIQEGDFDQARQMLDYELSQTNNELPSTHNSFLRLRLKVATSLEEFLALAPRMPAGVYIDEDGYELPQWWNENNQFKPLTERFSSPQEYLDLDSIYFLNRKIPIDILVRSVELRKLPLELNDQLRLSTWTRATLLGRWDIVRQLLPDLLIQFPQMKDVFTEMMSEQDTLRLQFLATVAIAKDAGIPAIHFRRPCSLSTLSLDR